jgi:phage terminase small subunit
MKKQFPIPLADFEPETRRWIKLVTSSYELDPHHVRLLLLAGQAWDRCQQAREALTAHGLVFTGPKGQPLPRPEIAVERDSRIAFARLVRELDLDVGIAAPESKAPPQLRSIRGR